MRIVFTNYYDLMKSINYSQTNNKITLENNMFVSLENQTVVLFFFAMLLGLKT